MNNIEIIGKHCLLFDSSARFIAGYSSEKSLETFWQLEIVHLEDDVVQINGLKTDRKRLIQLL